MTSGNSPRDVNKKFDYNNPNSYSNPNGSNGQNAGQESVKSGWKGKIIGTTIYCYEKGQLKSHSNSHNSNINNNNENADQ